MALWHAEGVAFLSTINLRGGPSIIGSSWCSHVLNVLLLYCLSSHYFRWFLFSSVGGNGIEAGLGGGCCLVGQSQCWHELPDECRIVDICAPRDKVSAHSVVIDVIKVRASV